MYFNELSIYFISVLLFFTLIKSSTIPLRKGPGRYSASNAIMSSNFSIFIFFIRLLIPADSHWKTPIVSAFVSNSYVFSSFSGISFNTIFVFLLFSIFSTVFRKIVRFFNPRKSIFKIPSSSSSFI